MVAPLPSSLCEAEVLSVHHWTDRLFSYSVASASYDEFVEFLSIKVENGPLTSKLRSIVPGRVVQAADATAGAGVVVIASPRVASLLAMTD